MHKVADSFLAVLSVGVFVDSDSYLVAGFFSGDVTLM